MAFSLEITEGYCDKCKKQTTGPVVALKESSRDYGVQIIAIHEDCLLKAIKNAKKRAALG